MTKSSGDLSQTLPRKLNGRDNRLLIDHELHLLLPPLWETAPFGSERGPLLTDKGCALDDGVSWGGLAGSVAGAVRSTDSVLRKETG